MRTPLYYIEISFDENDVPDVQILCDDPTPRSDAEIAQALRVAADEMRQRAETTLH